MNNTHQLSIGYSPSVGMPAMPTVGNPKQPYVTSQKPTFDPEVEDVVDQDMRLTEHFTLREFIRSATAIRLDIDNRPSADEVARMKKLCENVLEPLRRRFGAIRITSGYRCKRLNDEVDGSRTSQHMFGEAADIHCGSDATGKKMYDYIRQNLEFDQMLVEMRGGKNPHIHCLHVSFKSDRGTNRKKCTSNYII